VEGWAEDANICIANICIACLRQDANICIACLRQVVAFAPKVIKCAIGAIKGN
jgi:hypothetical protein